MSLDRWQDTYQLKIKQIYKNRYYYLLLIPAIVYFILFHYKPMYGVLIAFKDYRMMDGILGSHPWAPGSITSSGCSAQVRCSIGCSATP